MLFIYLFKQLVIVRWAKVAILPGYLINMPKEKFRSQSHIYDLAEGAERVVSYHYSNHFQYAWNKDNFAMYIV